MHDIHAMNRSDPTPSIDQKALRECLGAFYTGVTVVTTKDEGGDCFGTTVNSFSSVSLDPPLVLWSQRLASSTFSAFSEARYFAVNILAEDQIEMARRFSSGLVDKFAGLNTRLGLGGVPIIPGCSAYIECARVMSYPGGDHVIYLGRVERIETSRRPPLVFGSGKYQRLERPETLADNGGVMRSSQSKGLSAVAF